MEIKLFLNVSPTQRDGQQIPSPFVVPHHLYKNQDDSGDMIDKFEVLSGQGIHGVILPPIQFPRDVRNLKTLITIAPPTFAFLYSCASQDLLPHLADMASLKTADDHDITSNLSVLLEYRNNDDGTDEEMKYLHASLAQARQNGLHTTLSISEAVYVCDDVQAIKLANAVGTMIDTVQGCDLIWISSQSKSNDAIVPICEELMYLDVAGPTIKSRLLVDSVDEDILEEIMFAGVNKFVIKDESQIETVDNVAVQQGKFIVR